MSDLFENAVRSLEERKAAYLRNRRPTRNRPDRLRWLRLTEEPLTATIRSPLEWWYSHWEPAAGRSRRCPGPECALCEAGMTVQLRYVLALELDDGRVELLELREPQQRILEQLNDAPHGQIGARIRVFKAWRQKNAPVVIELVNRRQVVPIELSRLVATLGLEAKFKS